MTFFDRQKVPVRYTYCVYGETGFIFKTKPSYPFSLGSNVLYICTVHFTCDYRPYNTSALHNSMPKAKQFDQVEKTKIKLWSDEGIPFKEIAQRLGRNAAACRKIAASLRDLPLNGTPPAAKKRSGRPRLTTSREDERLRRAVLAKPFMTAKEAKREVAGCDKLSVRSIQHILKKRLNIPARRAAKKPLLTPPMVQKRLRFARKYLHWTEDQWEEVMFSDESTFAMINPRASTVRRPKAVSRYLNRFTVKTVKHPPSVMVWACFSGKGGRGSLYFLPPKTTMNADRYLQVVESKLLPFMAIHDARHFLQDGAPCHKAKKVMEVLKKQPFGVIDWPGNSPDLNPIENIWAIMKAKLKGNHKVKCLADLIQAIKVMWVKDMTRDLFRKHARSMPNRLRMVIQNNGQMIKY